MKFRGRPRARNHGVAKGAGVEFHDHVGLILQKRFRAVDRDLVAKHVDLSQRRRQRVGDPEWSRQSALR